MFNSQISQLQKCGSGYVYNDKYIIRCVDVTGYVVGEKQNANSIIVIIDDGTMFLECMIPENVLSSSRNAISTLQNKVIRIIGDLMYFHYSFFQTSIEQPGSLSEM